MTSHGRGCFFRWAVEAPCGDELDRNIWIDYLGISLNLISLIDLLIWHPDQEIGKGPISKSMRLSDRGNSG